VRPSGGSDPGPLIRPYALIGGRTTASRSDLAIEDLVTADASGPSAMASSLPDEHRAIMSLCAGVTISVAEVAARLHVPLGVTRILVGDLADQGLLRIHRAEAGLAADGRPDTHLLKRVLARLYAL
jgi:Protein of unknown function (DUF742)